METGGTSEPQEALRRLIEREPERHDMIVALVSPLGTPTDVVEQALREAFTQFGYRTVPVALSQLLDAQPYQPWKSLPQRGETDYYEQRMNAGDDLRSDARNGSVLAALAIAKVVEDRRSGRQRPAAYVLRSLKHPAEEALLRHVYGDAFLLLGVSSSIEERREKLVDALAPFQNPRGRAELLIERDEADPSRRDFGQNVRSVYSRSDAYIAVTRGIDVREAVNRFVDSMFGAPFLTPRPAEEAMRLAATASLRSAAIGRQVGAALIPKLGTPVVVGTNEVPKSGGGQFWTDDVPDYRDFQTGEDPNPLYTRRVVQEVLERLGRNGWLKEELGELSGGELLRRASAPEGDHPAVLDGARAAALIEFTRCLHAEQAAIVNAARAGVSTQEAALYSTTFPCHECAKMIVGAGISELYYIEPYPKSLVSRLYRDVVDTAPSPASAGATRSSGKVPFRPFEGIAPRRYDVVFTAGCRRNGAEVATFDRTKAPPRTGGWNSAIEVREDVAIKAVYEILTALAQQRPIATQQSLAPEAESGTLSAKQSLGDPTSRKPPAEETTA